MKFGEYLKSQMEADWVEHYLHYDHLKDVLKSMQSNLLAVPDNGIGTSLSTPLPITVAGVQTDAVVSQEKFFSLLDHEMKKIETFTSLKIDEFRANLLSVERHIDEALRRHVGQERAFLDGEGLQCHNQVEEWGNAFLRLEKYVNLNYIAFTKILKKHDKHLPNPCREFYTSRLQEQSWVRGDYSDIMVAMSRIYSKLRRDKVVEKSDTAKQNFVRSTRKYWVHTEDISAVKYTILQHLPVFLQEGMKGDRDSQLTTSIYVDNAAMELYQGRLDKTPGAIALRFRWYGSSKPVDRVYVERKTHREKWMGEVSVKERFTVKEAQVLELLQGRFNVDHEVENLRQRGKAADEIEEYHLLASEVVEAIKSRQLFPTMRTQYMRTAFQIPFDPSVRISLDTNLTMINERTPEVYAGTRWFRDPAAQSASSPTIIPANEITRFPHAVLEVKLQLEDEAATPAWVTDLLTSGKLHEVHKFSKFIHGCAVLLSEEVSAMPYWIDDVTLAESIVKSGAAAILAQPSTSAASRSYLLPHDTQGHAKAKLRVAQGREKSTSSSSSSSLRPMLGWSVWSRGRSAAVYEATMTRSPPQQQQLRVSLGQRQGNLIGSANASSVQKAGQSTASRSYSSLPASAPSYVTPTTSASSHIMGAIGADIAAPSSTSEQEQETDLEMGTTDLTTTHQLSAADTRDVGLRARNNALNARSGGNNAVQCYRCCTCACWTSSSASIAALDSEQNDENAKDNNGLCSWASASSSTANTHKQLPVQKVEPKVYFANERTFLSWLNMAVFMSSMSVAVMAFANNTSLSSLAFAFILLPLSLIFIGYALQTFLKRGRMITLRDKERWDDPFGPPVLAGLLFLALGAVFLVKLVLWSTTAV